MGLRRAAAAAGTRRSTPPTSPAGALHHQGPPAAVDQGLNGLELAVVELRGRVPDQLPQYFLGLRMGLRRRGRRSADSEAEGLQRSGYWPLLQYPSRLRQPRSQGRRPCGQSGFWAGHPGRHSLAPGAVRGHCGLQRKIRRVTSDQTKTFDLSASFKAYDVRGIVGESITAEIVEAWGPPSLTSCSWRARRSWWAATCAPPPPSSARPSQRRRHPRSQRPAAGPDLHRRALLRLRRPHAAGATFTASHNPAEYNGIKMAKAGAVPISSESGSRKSRPAPRSTSTPAPSPRRPPAA